MAEQQHNDHGDDRQRGDQQQPAIEAAGRILDPAHRVGPGEAGKVADRVDHRDTGGGGRTGQNGCRQGPEHWKRPEHAAGANGEGDDGESR